MQYTLPLALALPVLSFTSYHHLPTDGDAVLSGLGAGIVNPDDDEDVLELALDVGDERTSPGFLKFQNLVS